MQRILKSHSKGKAPRSISDVTITGPIYLNRRRRVSQSKNEYFKWHKCLT